MDAGNLLAFDPSPVDPEAFRADPDQAQLELSTRMTQSLFATVFNLPSESAGARSARRAGVQPERRLISGPALSLV